MMIRKIGKRMTRRPKTVCWKPHKRLSRAMFWTKLHQAVRCDLRAVAGRGGEQAPSCADGL
jgi:hypothetical protein